ncbi:retinol dehydrogenase 8-like [Diadema antillarum]|uniref:retinol dehydrogenase 8-like n=1 Tax=Diadema antillarum TaxID=105358 RepID=UPI003A8A49D8
MAQKVMLITGCSTGIGLSMAVRFAKDAAKKYLVIPTMRNMKKKGPLEEAAGVALDDTLHIRQLDVVDDTSVAESVEKVVEDYGRIDILINNAGVASLVPFEYATMDNVRAVMDTNFLGTTRMMQAVLPHMKRQQYGHIINIGSNSGINGYPFYDLYTASKHAVDGLTEAMATRMKAHNIRVTSVIPGPVDSNINDNMGEQTRLPTKAASDQITLRQARTINTHMKYHFKYLTQTADEVTDVVQAVLEKDDIDGPLRVHTSEYVRNMAAIKYSDLGLNNWVRYIRTLLRCELRPLHLWLAVQDSKMNEG